MICELFVPPQWIYVQHCSQLSVYLSIYKQEQLQIFSIILSYLNLIVWSFILNIYWSHTGHTKYCLFVSQYL